MSSQRHAVIVTKSPKADVADADVGVVAVAVASAMAATSVATSKADLPSNHQIALRNQPLILTTHQSNPETKRAAPMPKAARRNRRSPRAVKVVKAANKTVAPAVAAVGAEVVVVVAASLATKVRQAKAAKTNPLRAQSHLKVLG